MRSDAQAGQLESYLLYNNSSTISRKLDNNKCPRTEDNCSDDDARSTFFFCDDPMITLKLWPDGRVMNIRRDVSRKNYEITNLLQAEVQKNLQHMHVSHCLKKSWTIDLRQVRQAHFRLDLPVSPHSRFTTPKPFSESCSSPRSSFSSSSSLSSSSSFLFRAFQLLFRQQINKTKR